MSVIRWLTRALARRPHLSYLGFTDDEVTKTLCERLNGIRDIHPPRQNQRPKAQTEGQH